MVEGVKDQDDYDDRFITVPAHCARTPLPMALSSVQVQIQVRRMIMEVKTND